MGKGSGGTRGGARNGSRGTSHRLTETQGLSKALDYAFEGTRTEFVAKMNLLSRQMSKKDYANAIDSAYLQSNRAYAQAHRDYTELPIGSNDYYEAARATKEWGEVKDRLQKIRARLKTTFKGNKFQPNK